MINLNLTNHSKVTYPSVGGEVVSQELEAAPPGVDVVEFENQIEFLEDKLGISYMRAREADLRNEWLFVVNVRANSWTLVVWRPDLVELARLLVAS